MQRLVMLYGYAVAAATAAGLLLQPVQAQQAGISRVGQGVQPAAVPTLPQPQQPLAPPPPIHTPGAPSAMPTPLPGGPLPAPIDLKREALERVAPLTAAEIVDLRQELNRRQAATQQPLEPVAKPVRRVVTLDLAPGATPEVVRTAFTQGSVISFVDAAGRAWPVKFIDNFNPGGFSALDYGGHGVSIGVNSPNARSGSIAVLLEGMTEPVTFTLANNQREVDYSVEVQVPRYLPGQPVPVGSVDQMKSLGAPELMDYLMNTPPKGARMLQTDSANVKVWQISAERMILRTDALVASPAWQRRQSSNSGVNVYDLPITPRVLLAQQGQLVTVQVTGFAGTKEQK